MDPHTAARRGPKPRLGVRDTIIQAGLNTIYADGYAATGIQRIVEAAAVPKGSFYTYFPSKEAFGTDVIDAYFERARARLERCLGNTELTPPARLEAYFDALIATFRDTGFLRGCLLGNFSAEAADHSAAIRARLVQHFRTWSHLFEACIAEGQRHGQIPDRLPAAVLADFMLNSWEGALLRMRAERSDAPLIAFKTVIFGALLG
jgi:TetR/AcrR family transcriptional repressor of nem operon